MEFFHEVYKYCYAHSYQIICVIVSVGTALFYRHRILNAFNVIKKH